MLRRLVQAYLAAGQAAEELVANADLDWRDAERVRFMVENLVEAMAPSNVPLVNPASAKAAIDTAGLSLVRGARNLLRDMASAPRVPAMVDTSGFEVGRNIAATPGAVVLRTEMLELIQYTPQTDQVRRIPLLIVPPTINKHYALDLAPGRSLVEYLVGQGQQVFMISWRNPDARHAALGPGRLRQRGPARRWTRSSGSAGTESTALAGVCSGGIIASLAAAHLAATGRQDRLAAFTLLVTVLDNAQAGTSAALVDEPTAAAAKAMSRRRGYLDGRALAEVFAWLRPGDLIWNYWVNNYLLGKQPPAFDILFWNADTTRMTAAAARRLHRHRDGQRPGHAGRGHASSARRSTCRGRRRHLRDGRHRRPHHALAELLPQHPAARRRHPVRAVHQRPHRRPGQPARQPQGDLPDQQGQLRRRAAVAAVGAAPSRAAGGPTSRPGSASAAARQRCTRPNSAAVGCARWPRHPAPTSSRTEEKRP